MFKSTSVLCETDNSPHLSQIHAPAFTHNLALRDVNPDIS